MKFKALSTFVIFNGQMNVFNAGDEGDLPEEQIANHIAGGLAEAVAEPAAPAAQGRRRRQPAAVSEPVIDADAPPV